jgi:MFS superfamily sulfate permease-like transporter
LFLVAGLLRLGFVAQFLSRPVVEGFVFGLAIFVTVKQLPKLFGIEGGSGDTIRQFGHLVAHLGDTSGATLAVGAGALALLFGAERFWPRLPGGLVVLVLGIAISALLNLSQHGGCACEARVLTFRRRTGAACPPCRRANVVFAPASNAARGPTPMLRTREPNSARER